MASTNILIQEIATDMELLRAYMRQEEILTDEQEKQLNKKPESQKDEIRKKYLDENKKQKQERVYGFIMEMEKKVKSAHLPPEIKGNLLQILAQVKNTGMEASPEVLIKIEAVRTEMAEAENRQQMENASLSLESLGTTAMASVAAVSLLTPFLQNPWNEKVFNEKNDHYYNNSFLTDLATASSKDKQILLPKESVFKSAGLGFAQDISPILDRGVGKKEIREAFQNSSLSAPTVQSANSHKHTATQIAQAEELGAILVQNVQAKQKEMELPIQDTQTILMNLSVAHPAQRNLAKRAIYEAHPDLKQKHHEQDQEVKAEEIIKGIIRQERKATQGLLKRLKTLNVEAQNTSDKDAFEKLKDINKKARGAHQKINQLDLFMDNFTFALQKNNLTANALLQKAYVGGKCSATALVEHVNALNLTGLVKQHEGLKKSLRKNQQTQKTPQNKASSKGRKQAVLSHRKKSDTLNTALHQKKMKEQRSA